MSEYVYIEIWLIFILIYSFYINYDMNIIYKRYPSHQKKEDIFFSLTFKFSNLSYFARISVQIMNDEK